MLFDGSQRIPNFYLCYSTKVKGFQTFTCVIRRKSKGSTLLPVLFDESQRVPHFYLCYSTKVKGFHTFTCVIRLSQRVPNFYLCYSTKSKGSKILPVLFDESQTKDSLVTLEGGAPLKVKRRHFVSDE